MDTTGLLNTGEVAKRLNRHPGTVVNWRTWKRGPKYQMIDGQVWYKPEDVDAYAKKQKGAAK
jgi:hypothetical protein